MAQATTKQITRTIQEEGVVLTLSKAEAETILDVLSAVAGCPINSRRKHVDAAYAALGPLFGPRMGRATDLSGRLVFEDEEAE